MLTIGDADSMGSGGTTWGRVMQARGSIHPLRATVGMATAALLMGATACASSTPPATAAKERPASASASAQPPAAAPLATQEGCLKVKEVFLRLASVSARWDPVSNPFDRHTADELGPLAHQLRAASRSAPTAGLKVAAVRNADALVDLASGMRSGQQTRVTAALARVRNAYATLPGCARRGGGPATTANSESESSAGSGPASGPSSGSNAGPPTNTTTSQPGVFVKEARKDPGCVGAKVAYGRLGPITAGWDLQGDPFDADTAAAFADTAAALDAAAHASGSSAIASEIRANGEAFARLAAAMGDHDRSAVSDGVVAMQKTAIPLASTCPLA